jgi:chromosomal replication initiation ATPase DnaA
MHKATGPAVSSTITDGANNEDPQARSPAANVVTEPLALPAAIQLIRQHICERFYLREMRDPELTVRSNRSAYVLPRQIAMYLVKQLTGASLQEIGTQFGGKHHTTVLHSINKIEELRRSDRALNTTITRLMEACAP